MPQLAQNNGQMNVKGQKMRITIAVIILLLTSTTAHSEPNTTIKYLMNDRVTMLEWALFKLENRLESIDHKGLDLYRNSSTAQYHWNENRITLTSAVYPDYGFLKSSSAKEICTQAHQTIKRILGYGMDPDLRESNGLVSFFKHRVRINKNMPNNFSKEIEKMTRIIVKVYASKSNSPQYDHKLTCSSMFLEDKVNFSDKAFSW